MAPAKSPTKTTKKVARPLSNHPTTLQMIKDAIEALQEPKGVPAGRIKMYICEKYKDINPATLKPRLRQAFTKGMEKGIFVQSKSTSEKPVLLSRFRLVKQKKEKETKPKTKTTDSEKKAKDGEKKTKTVKPTKSAKATGDKIKSTKTPKKTKAEGKAKEVKPKKVKTPVKTTKSNLKTTKPKAPKTPKTPKTTKAKKVTK